MGVEEEKGEETPSGHQVSKVTRGLHLGAPCRDTPLDQHHHSNQCSAMRAMSSEDTFLSQAFC